MTDKQKVSGAFWSGVLASSTVIIQVAAIIDGKYYGLHLLFLIPMGFALFSYYTIKKIND